MNILIVGRLFGSGGAERSLMPLAKQLAHRGYDLTLLLVRSPQQDTIFHEFPGTVIKPLGESIGQRLRGLGQLSDAIAQADLVIVTSELTPTYITWLLSRWHRKPLIADVQVYLSRWITDGSHPIHHTLSRWVYPRLRSIRCVAKGVAHDLQSHYHVPAAQLSVIYVPFELGTIAQAAQQPIHPDHHAIFSRPVIVSVGRFTSQKRFDVAIAAFHELVRSRSIDAHLLILGDGEQRSQLEQQVQSLGLTERVFMPGFVPNPHAYVRRSQAFLLSSDYEGLPRVLIEALAVGCPTVATNCPSGPDEILEGGKWGLLVPMNDSTAIATALFRVLTDGELAKTLSQQGIQRAQAFNADTVASQYQSLIEDCLTGDAALIGRLPKSDGAQSN